MKARRFEKDKLKHLTKHDKEGNDKSYIFEEKKATCKKSKTSSQGYDRQHEKQIQHMTSKASSCQERVS